MTESLEPKTSYKLLYLQGTSRQRDTREDTCDCIITAGIILPIIQWGCHGSGIVMDTDRNSCQASTPSKQQVALDQDGRSDTAFERYKPRKVETDCTFMSNANRIACGSAVRKQRNLKRQSFNLSALTASHPRCCAVRFACGAVRIDTGTRFVNDLESATDHLPLETAAASRSCARIHLTSQSPSSSPPHRYRSAHPQPDDHSPATSLASTP